MEQETIGLVHSTFCNKQHTHNPEDLMNPQKQDKCRYYLENQVEHGDSMKDHLLWAKETQEIADTLMLETDDNVLRFLDRLTRVMSDVLLFQHNYPKSKEILKRALRL